MKDFLKGEENEKFQDFIETLSSSNKDYKYFVNWDKVKKYHDEREMKLNTLNYLIGKEDIYEKAIELFERQPDLLELVPILLACREKKMTILEINEQRYKDFDFENIDKTRIKDYVDFMKKTELLTFIQKYIKMSLVDYVSGVEVGLDSNGRKNRSGTTMETIVENNIKKFCSDEDFEYNSQCTADYIKEKWNIEVPTDKSKRKFDFVVYSKRKDKIIIIETNYYGSSGSKLKSVVGEFTSLNNLINTSKDKDKIVFTWITDGQGWLKETKPLLAAFDHVSNIINLSMLSKDNFLSLYED